MRKHVSIGLLALFAASCGGGVTDTVDPWGLSGVTLPDTAPAVAETLAAMPATIGGQSRTLTVEDAVEYGDTDEGGLALFAQPGEARAGADGDPMSPVGWITMLTESGEFDIEGSGLDPNADVVWVTGSTVYGDERGEQTAWLAVWGRPDGSWVFTATAGTQRLLSALVDAFVAASG